MRDRRPAPFSGDHVDARDGTDKCSPTIVTRSGAIDREYRMRPSVRAEGKRMVQRNVVAQDFLRRYVVRRDVFHKVSERFKRFVRLNTKDAFIDQRNLLRGSDIKVIFDVGANIGAVTQRYTKLFPQADVYSFEASPEIFPVLRNNFARENNVHAYQYAVSELDGEVKFNVNYNSGTSSIFTPSQYNLATWAVEGTESQVAVPSITIPTFCSRLNIDSVDILKLDIEGAELSALRGCAPLLARSRIKIIYTEACLTPLYEEQPLLHDLSQFLAGHGYMLYNIYQVVESKIRQGTITNATFLSPELRARLRHEWGIEHCGW